MTKNIIIGVLVVTVIFFASYTIGLSQHKADIPIPVVVSGSITMDPADTARVTLLKYAYLLVRRNLEKPDPYGDYDTAYVTKLQTIALALHRYGDTGSYRTIMDHYVQYLPRSVGHSYERACMTTFLPEGRHRQLLEAGKLEKAIEASTGSRARTDQLLAIALAFAQDRQNRQRAVEVTDMAYASISESTPCRSQYLHSVMSHYLRFGAVDKAYGMIKDQRFTYISGWQAKQLIIRYAGKGDVRRGLELVRIAYPDSSKIDALVQLAWYVDKVKPLQPEYEKILRDILADKHTDYGYFY